LFSNYVQIDQDKITEFHDRRILKPEKIKSYHQKPDTRPPLSAWRKIDKSPIYENDNELRSYQLEGLNWLTYCYYNRQNSILADEMG
jgi:SNF2 family DNA or RNA helicase